MNIEAESASAQVLACHNIIAERQEPKDEKLEDPPALLLEENEQAKAHLYFIAPNPGQDVNLGKAIVRWRRAQGLDSSVLCTFYLYRSEE